MIAALIRFFELIPHSLLALLARVIVGLVFFKSWLTKVDLPEVWNPLTWSVKGSTFFLFANEYKVPFIPPDIAAYAAATTEFAAPILLWLGLMTRLSATALLGMTLVIQIFVYPSSYMVHGLWAVALLTIMKYGPGKISLDHLLGGGNRE